MDFKGPEASWNSVCKTFTCAHVPQLSPNSQRHLCPQIKCWDPLLGGTRRKWEDFNDFVPGDYSAADWGLVTVRVAAILQLTSLGILLTAHPHILSPSCTSFSPRAVRMGWDACAWRATRRGVAQLGAHAVWAPHLCLFSPSLIEGKWQGPGNQWVLSKWERRACGGIT